jgi:glycosyltransferase involved in cell wall biosynthesis
MAVLGLSVGVIIPALNEERALPAVLAELPGDVDEIVVVDNGSADRTAEVARAAGARVALEPKRGYGAACLRGLVEIGSHDVIVFLDGDHSDFPENLPRLIAPLAANEADFVLGSRLMGRRERGAMPPQSVWGNRLACFLMRLLFGVHYTDLGPFRAMRRTALERLCMCDQDFGWTVEMQIKAARAGLRIREIPVPYRRRIGQSKISGTLAGTLRAGYKILWTIFKYGIRPVQSSPRGPLASRRAIVAPPHHQSGSPVR